MSINKVILIGNVGKDPDVKRFDRGGVVAQFPMATTKNGYKRDDGREIPDRTEWHNIVLQGKLAEVAEKYVHKGDRLYIEGELRTRSWEDGGVKRYVTEIYGHTMEMLSAKKSQAPAPEPEYTEDL